MATATDDNTHRTNAPASSNGSSEHGIDLAWLTQKIDYRRFQECIHCGLCTASCPTYVETGNENDSPRGRIYLMRAVFDQRRPMSPSIRRHLSLCLDCRACESACPSGVKYSQIIEPFKIALHKQPDAAGKTGPITRLILHRLFPYAGRVKLALAPVRILQRTGVWGLLNRLHFSRLLPGSLERMQAILPELEDAQPAIPEVLPPIGPKRARVALFTGCVADAIYPATNAATARVLQFNGCEVIVPRTQACCGAIHYHSGAEEAAVALARKNLAAFNPDDFDAIIVNAAGCGAMLKEYHHLLPDDLRVQAARFAGKVKDISEFLATLPLLPPANPLPLKVTYHDACHLCHAQQIRVQPRAMLQSIPEIQLVPLEESDLCCGAAGTYNITEPEMSQQLGVRKVRWIEQTEAEVVTAGNVGCIMQIARVLRERGSKARVAHPIDLLDKAYLGNTPPRTLPGWSRPTGD